MSLRDDLAHLIAEPRMHTNESLGHARATADAILARYAVVELPEANQSVTIGGDEWNVDESTTVFAVRNRVEFEGHAVWSESPEYAQTLAAALLAAARNAKAVEQ